MNTNLPQRPLFISPHLDDAAFSCGRLLASLPDAVVATVFAGVPPPGRELTDWDRAAGFERGDDVVAARRDEDRQALTRLAAWPVWLDFLDRQYAPEPAIAEVAAELHGLLRQCQADAVFFPLGLFHSDHRLTRRAALGFARACSGCDWFVYEDAWYRHLPGWQAEARAEFAQNGLALSPAQFTEADGAAARKREAVACYRSQLRALEARHGPGVNALDGAEIYWRLESKKPESKKAESTTPRAPA